MYRWISIASYYYYDWLWSSAWVVSSHWLTVESVGFSSTAVGRRVVDQLLLLNEDVAFGIVHLYSAWSKFCVSCRLDTRHPPRRPWKPAETRSHRFSKVRILLMMACRCLFERSCFPTGGRSIRRTTLFYGHFQIRINGRGDRTSRG